MLCRVQVARSKYKASKQQQKEEKEMGKDKVEDWLSEPQENKKDK